MPFPRAPRHLGQSSAATIAAYASSEPETLDAAMALAGWIAITFSRDLSFYNLLGLMMVTGFSSGTMVVSFAFAKESVPSHLAGTVTGVVNMGIMMGPMLLQPGVGWMLDRAWQGDAIDGVRMYSLEAYREGFSLMLAWLALAMLLVLFTSETDCEQLK